MTETLWLRHPAVCWTGNGANADNGLVVEGSRIRELVPAGHEPSGHYAHTFDASGHVLLPGLINTHHHFYQTLTRALPRALNKPLFPWLESLYPVWANLDDDAIHAATELALSELLLSGCTTAADHHYVFSQLIPRAIDVQVAAAKRMGARVTLTRGSMSFGELAGGLPPESVIEPEPVILSESARLIRAYHDPDPEALCRIALAPCSPFSVTPELMRDTANLAEEHDVLLHTHLGETRDETDFCIQSHGQRPLDYLEDVGWLTPRTWLAHGIHFTDDEIRRIADSGTAVCHCPTSNMLLGSGHFRGCDMHRAGVRVGLGVDGSASNDGSNMIQEARQAMLMQKLTYGADQFSHLDALALATSGGAQLLGRPELGQLAPGKQADLALFSLDEPRFSGHADPLAALLLCGAHRADHVMVGGQWKVRHGGLVDHDIQEIMARHKQAAERLIRRAAPA
ncbi:MULTISPECIES: 8-oxoguanine deaminase [Halomonadaceae]|uniref:8-oxoguanine deaminase n=1 Tax=Vreelandella halophila TaxID=86177 RepID=A0A9X4YH40_9GAMM|nr:MULTISPECIES: 8-oxoguanine deaminase [Halomonas]MYL27920.1 8-oxoguanine deaminase [Halomonas utahensis]MYL75046.1 8-oxoguanine deaminase [Halomonas sp. 22501_18_FS]